MGSRLSECLLVGSTLSSSFPPSVLIIHQVQTVPFDSGGSMDDKKQITGDSTQVNCSDVFCKHIATDHSQF